MSIDGLNFSRDLPIAAGGSGGGSRDAGQTGTFRGESVRTLDMQSTLADAAEEITLVVAEKIEDKELSDRKLEADHPSHEMSSEEIDAFLDDSHAGDDPGVLAQFAARLLSGRESPKNVAREFSGDVTQQFVLMQHALQQGRAGGAGAEILELLQEASAELQMEHGAAIRAGLNTAQAAGQHASNRAGVERFQGAYRDIALGEASLSGVLKVLLERLDSHDGAAFAKGLDATIRALGDDLSAQRPSAEPSRLQALVSDLYHLEVTATVVDHCNELCATLAAKASS
jgi:type III secretion protein W